MKKLNIKFKNTEIFQDLLSKDYSYFPAKISDKNVYVAIPFSENDVKICHTSTANDFIIPWIDFENTEKAEEFARNLYAFFIQTSSTPPFEFAIAYLEDSEATYAMFIKEFKT